MKRNGQGQIKTCRRKQHVKTDGMKGIPNLFCGIFAVGGNYNLTRDKYTWTVNNGRIGWAASESLLAENTNQKGTNYKWEMRKASNILSDLAQGKSVWGYLYSNEEVLSVCEKVGISPGFFSIDAGAGKHTYLLQESGKTINVDAKIKQLNDINWIEIGYKEGDTFFVYGKEYAIDSSGHINVSAEDEFTSTEIKYPSRSI